MRKPKPPTPLRVSATLRTAAFRAATGRRDEGYRVSWYNEVAETVRVEFQAASEDLPVADALVLMAQTLRYKGWQVTPMDRPACLLVKAG